MDNDVAIFWIIVLNCGFGLFPALKHLSSSYGWIGVLLAILLVDVLGWLCEWPALIYVAGLMWLALVLVPGLISRACQRRILQQDHAAAHRLARIMSWLHPADGWRQQPETIHALQLAQRGEITSAMETLNRLREVKSLVGLTAICNLYRVTGQWEDFLVWEGLHRQHIEKYPQFLQVRLRARGETGDLRGLVALYDQNKEKIAKLTPATSRDLCRVILFAFCGQPQEVERLFAGSLSILPARTRGFWLAATDLAAGKTERAKLQFEALLPTADPPLRLAIERGLSRIAIPPQPLDESALRVLSDASSERGHDERFGTQRSLFSKQARATQILIALNVLMFVIEISAGGATNQETLYKLGALFQPAVRAGEWWRLLASLFLHLGFLHNGVNMFALAVLGPFTEFALGARRFVLVYLLAGVGSMGLVMFFGSGPEGQQITVGASGCIMGLVGSTGALMLRAWLGHKAQAAKRRLAAVVLIIGMQTVFDSMVPQVSMTAHLSGALIGFIVTMILRDRLKSDPKQELTGAIPTEKPPG